MSDVLQLKTFLDNNVDNYRVLCSQKKEIKYSKLLDGNSFYNIQSISFKVYVKKAEMNYNIESNDVKYLVNCIKEWLSNPLNSDEVVWDEKGEYGYQNEISFQKHKAIYENYDFDSYHRWLDSISETVNAQESFLYYGDVEEVQLLTNKIDRKQYLVRSQMLCYDMANNNFIINENNVFLSDNITRRKKVKRKEIGELFINNDINLIRIDFKVLSDVLRVVFDNFKGENIIGLNSSLKKDSLGTLWLNEDIDIFINSTLSFDSEGFPKKPVPIIEKGIIKNFMNTSYAMCILQSEECGFSEFDTRDYGFNNELIYEIEVPTNSKSHDCSIIKADVPIMLITDNVITIQINVHTLFDSIHYEGIITFNFQEFMNHLFKNQGNYLVSKKVIGNLQI